MLRILDPSRIAVDPDGGHCHKLHMVSLNRVVMGPSSRRIIKALEPHKLDAAEVSGHWGNQFNFKRYDIYRYPRWDICKGPYTDRKTGEMQTYDLILANQVWEHLDRPYAATRHVFQMLRAGGYFWIAVPFFIPFHAAPQDNSRWSARGLKNLLIEGGFEEEAIVTEQWGNRHVAMRNLEEPWPPEYDEATDDIKNDPMMPICAWALAQKI